MADPHTFSQINPDWKDDTRLDLALEYISNQGSDDAFEDFLREKAEEEDSIEDEEEGKPLAQVAYEAYCEHADWKAWNGDPIPQWSELGPETGVQEKWAVAVKAVADAIWDAR